MLFLFNFRWHCLGWLL